MSEPRDQSFSSVPPPPAAPRALPPAGWFPDPGGRHEHRYWDGAEWTDHVADRGVGGVDPVAAAATVAATAHPSAVAAPPAGLAPPPSIPADRSDRSAWWAPDATTTGPAAGPVRSLRGLATALTVTLWTTAGVAVLGVIAHANRVSVVDDVLDARKLGDFVDAQGRADDADAFVGVVTFLMILLSLTIFVLLIIWMWRVAKNAEVLGRTEPRWKPGWTIGGWFIPFANLVIPVLVMQELWRGTDPEAPRRDPLWRSRPGSALVGWWWALYLASVVRFGVGTDNGDAAAQSQLKHVRTEDLIAAFGMAASVGAAILLILVVRRLTQRQQTLLGATPPPA
jgi:uncharacterized protein DUF4328/uncharacterized protein DUF2510